MGVNDHQDAEQTRRNRAEQRIYVQKSSPARQQSDISSLSRGVEASVKISTEEKRTRKCLF